MQLVLRTKGECRMSNALLNSLNSTVHKNCYFQKEKK